MSALRRSANSSYSSRRRQSLAPATPDAAGEIHPSPQPPAPPAWSMGGPSYPPQPGAIRWDLAWKGLCCAALARRSFRDSHRLVRMLSVDARRGRLAVVALSKAGADMLITPGMGMNGRPGRSLRLSGERRSDHGVVRGVSLTGDFRRAMQEQMDKQMSNNPDPKVREMMQRMLDWIARRKAATMMVLVLVALVCSCCSRRRVGRWELAVRPAGILARGDDNCHCNTGRERILGLIN